MEYLAGGLKGALLLIFSGDAEVYRIVWLSLKIALIASLTAAFLGIPPAFLLAQQKFRGREFLLTILNTLMAMPTVVIGLILYSLISRKGPLGFLDLLYTPTAMIIGDIILAFPIITALSAAALTSVDPRVKLTAFSLGANRIQAMFKVLGETRGAIFAAVINGFGRVIAEVGCAMIIGGNIRGYTRTMTTAIALETSKGEFAFALALGFLLLSTALAVNILMRVLQRERT